MPIEFSGRIQRVLTDTVVERLHRSLGQFPELAGRTIKVGLTKRCEGTAEAERMTIRLHVGRRRTVSYFTIGHELTHLLQSAGLGIVPDGEVQCDVWTLARSELFLDDPPTYFCRHLWSKSNWPHHAAAVRQLCIDAIELRKNNRRYLMWLQKSAGETFGRVPLTHRH